MKPFWLFSSLFMYNKECLSASLLPAHAVICFGENKDLGVCLNIVQEVLEDTPSYKKTKCIVFDNVPWFLMVDNTSGSGFENEDFFRVIWSETWWNEIRRSPFISSCLQQTDGCKLNCLVQLLVFSSDNRSSIGYNVPQLACLQLTYQKSQHRYKGINSRNST